MPVTSDDVKLEVFNLALLHIGERPAASLVESSKGALLLQRLYARTVTTVLSGFPWAFAEEMVALELTDPQPTAFRYALSYNLPADCLRAWKVITEGMAWDAESQIPFKRVGNTLRCDVEDASLVYTKNITDATLFDPLFIDVLAKTLAVHISLPVTGNPVIQNNVFRLLQLTAPHAEAATANEKNEKGAIDSSIKGSRA